MSCLSVFIAKFVGVILDISILTNDQVNNSIDDESHYFLQYPIPRPKIFKDESYSPAQRFMLSALGLICKAGSYYRIKLLIFASPSLQRRNFVEEFRCIFY